MWIKLDGLISDSAAIKSWLVGLEDINTDGC